MNMALSGYLSSSSFFSDLKEGTTASIKSACLTISRKPGLTLNPCTSKGIRSIPRPLMAETTPASSEDSSLFFSSSPIGAAARMI